MTDRLTRPSPGHTGAAVIVLVAVTLAVYGQVTGFDFINYDDPHYVYLNEHVTSGLSWENLVWSLTAREVGLWHPLTWLSHQWDTSVAGPRAAGYRHAVNVGLHAASVILVYLLVLRLSGSRGGSLAVALLFAVHPQHVQSVAWITERKDTLSAVFTLASALVFTASREIPARRGRYALSVILYLLAALSKPSVVALPLVLWLIDRWFGPPSSWRARLWRVAPYVVIAALAAAITVFHSRDEGANEALQAIMPLGKRLALMPIGMLHYLRTLFIPWPLPFFVAAPETVTLAQVAASSLVVAAVAVAVWRAGRSDALIRFGGLWFVIMWLPVSGLVAFSQYYVADRYTYLPHVGAFIAVVWILGHRFGRYSRWRPVTAVIAAVVVIAYAGLAFRQTGYWRDSVTLFEREFAVNPSNVLAAIHVGEALTRGGRPDRALPYFEHAVALDADGYMAHLYLGHALRELGRTDEAVAAFRKAIEVGADRPDAHVNLGAMMVHGDPSGAVEILEQGLALFPDNVALLNHLGYAAGFFTQGPESGVDYFQRVLALDAGNLYALNAISALYLGTGRPWLAAAYSRLALEHDPGNAAAREMLAQTERQHNSERHHNSE